MWTCVRWEWRRQTHLWRFWGSLASLAGMGLLFAYVYEHLRQQSPLQALVGQEIPNSFFVPVLAVAVSSLVLLPFFVTMVSGDAISGERQSGTWFMLLTQGIPPWRLYFAKWLIAVTYAWLAVAVLVGSSLVGGLALFGWRAAILPAGTVASSTDLIRLLLVLFAYCSAGQTAVASLALCVSAFSRHTVSTVMVMMGGLLFMALLGDFPIMPEAQQLFLTDYFSRAADVLGVPLNWSSLGRGVAVYGIYCVCSWLLVIWLEPFRQ